MRALAALLLALVPALGGAEPGSVDWQRQVVRCTGSGAANLPDAQGNVAVARIGAERAARLDALRNCLEAVKGVRIQGAETVGQATAGDPQLRARVEGLVKGFRTVGKPRYFSDGGVEMDVEVPLDGISEAVLPPAPPAPAPAPSGAAGEAPGQGATGLLVDARGTGVLPALAPRIVDGRGRTVYSAAQAGAEALRRSGAVAYAGDLEVARKQLAGRLGERPRLVKAVRALGTDVVIPEDDADALLPGPPAFLAEARVVIVTDGGGKP